MTGDPSWLTPAVVLAVLRRPGLWVTALRQLARLGPRGWWRQPPRRPELPAAYLRFRMVTAYGDAGASPDPDDVVAYLRWCRGWPDASR